MFLTAEKRVSEYIDRSIEIIQTNEKRMNKMEWIITELWETVNNLTYIYKVGISEGEKREVIIEKILMNKCAKLITDNRFKKIIELKARHIQRNHALTRILISEDQI